LAKNGNARPDHEVHHATERVISNLLFRDAVFLLVMIYVC
jgi:hypothetical protein